jgi:hypothetical protein
MPSLGGWKLAATWVAESADGRAKVNSFAGLHLMAQAEEFEDGGLFPLYLRQVDNISLPLEVRG